MNPIYVFVGALVLTIAWFRMDLLIRARSFAIILGISISLGVLGIALHIIQRDSYLSGALLCPLLTLALFRTCRRLFMKIVKREPRDTLLDWSPGLGRDQLFNVLYFILGSLILVFFPVIIHRLTKAGW